MYKKNYIHSSPEMGVPLLKRLGSRYFTSLVGVRWFSEVSCSFSIFLVFAIFAVLEEALVPGDSHPFLSLLRTQ